MEKHSVSRLIGSPPGYVGYDEGGQLTEKIRRKPYSVVLFDEVEKAHPDVLNILLQILDDGMLTDAQGRRVDFKNTVIILTSNIGASAITEKAKSLGFTAAATDEKAAMKANVMQALKSAFRPEFLNRLDEIIVFNRLTDADIRKIASLLLAELGERIRGIGVEIEFDPSLVAYVAEKALIRSTVRVRCGAPSQALWRTASPKPCWRVGSLPVTAFWRKRSRERFSLKSRLRRFPTRLDKNRKKPRISVAFFCFRVYSAAVPSVFQVATAR